MSQVALVLNAPGRLPYATAWALQKELVQERLTGRRADTLLLVEHEPVITLGRGTRAGWRTPAVANLAAATALPASSELPVFEVERGGQATYHGPGQIVAYPIVKLAEGRHDLHGWLRALEQAAIETLAAAGLSAGRRPGATGVWMDGARKLCSLGVAASRWVTYHGLALNHDPDLAQFRAIQPCGFDAEVMTSMRRECERLGLPLPPREDVATRLVAALERCTADFREQEGG
ncbi:MAG: lipoyl(octanoyl) transferase LipB [Planctomycetota bacterium]